MAETYIQLGDLKSAEKAYIENIQGDECKKPYNIIPFTNGFEDKNWGTENNRYDLASPRHFHDRVINARPEGWVVLGDFYLQHKKDPAKAEEAYKKAVAFTTDEIYKTGGQASGPNTYTSSSDYPTFLKRLANVYAKQGKTREAIQTWQRIQNIKPDDPDLQKMIQQSQQLKK